MYPPKIGLLATAVTVAALASAPATSADAGPVGSCPQGFTPITLATHPSLAFLDRNADAILCSKPLPNFPSPPEQPMFEVIDNNVRRGVPTG